MADLQSLAWDLYGIPLDEFITARTEQFELARDDGQTSLATQIKKLRKPHAAAWALNLMCRERMDLLQDVIDLGEELRDAQASSDGATIKRLDLTRRELMKKVAREATVLANRQGLSLSAAASEGMEQTLWAAMLDPEAAAGVLTGLLVAPISAGMEADELEDVVAIADPSTPSRPRVAKKATRKEAATSPEELEEAAQDLAANKKAAKDASRQVDALTKKRSRLAVRLEQLEEDREDLREQLKSVEDELADVEQDIKEVDRDSRSAVTSADRAQKDLDRAKARHDALNAS